MSESRETGTSAARALLIDAFTKAVAERGYANVSVERVSSEAGLSPQVFFENFDSKAQCLLAAYDTFVDRLFSHAVRASAHQSTWPEQVKAATGAILDFFSEVESASRVFTVEAPGAGAAAFERRITSIDRFAALLRSGRERYPAAAVLPGATEWVLVRFRVAGHDAPARRGRIGSPSASTRTGRAASDALPRRLGGAPGGGRLN